MHFHYIKIYARFAKLFEIVCCIGGGLGCSATQTLEKNPMQNMLHYPRNVKMAISAPFVILEK